MPQRLLPSLVLLAALGAPLGGPAAAQEFCAGRLAHFKVPRHLRILDAFPMTVSGKVRKVELREGFSPAE